MKINSSPTIRPVRRTGSQLHQSGFTLVEILVVIAIVSVLAVVSLNVANKAKKSGIMVKELNAAKNLTAALVLGSQDQNGLIPYGFDGEAKPVAIEGSGFQGAYVSGEQAHRYPFRLAQYFGYKFEDNTVIERSSKRWLDKKDTYRLSLAPSLGMNVYGVGGYVEFGEKEPIPGAIRQMSTAISPEKMIAFISARFADTYDGGIAPGFHMVTPPKTPGGDWSPNYIQDDPTSWGHVDLRHNDKAVVGYLDGSAGTLGRDKLEDMRLWNNEAARLEDPYHRPVVSTGGGRGR